MSDIINLPVPEDVNLPDVLARQQEHDDLTREVHILDAKISELQRQRSRLITRVLAIRSGRE